jgi:hypothetical protein
MCGGFNDDLKAISGDNSCERMLALRTELCDFAPLLDA